MLGIVVVVVLVVEMLLVLVLFVEVVLVVASYGHNTLRPMASGTSSMTSSTWLSVG